MRTYIVVVTGLLAIAGAFACPGAPAAQDIYDRTIRGEQLQRISIAVAGFAPYKAEREDLGRVGEATLVADLKFTTLFDVMEGGLLPFDPKTVQLDRERALLPGLNALKVQHLAVGQVSGGGREVTVEGRLFNVATGDLALSKRYTGDMRYFRLILHRFADDIVFQLTGEKGVAQTRMAFVGANGRAKELFVMDYDGAGVEPITGTQSINLSPRWSPDGKQIAYTSYQRDPQSQKDNANLLILNWDSGRRTVLSARPGLNMSPAWSPDGQWLAFATTGGSGTNIFLMPKGGGEAKPLTTGPSISVSPSFSPNGRQIVFNSDRGGSPQLYIVDVDGTNLRRLTLQGNYNASPRWSPRGERIVFMCQQGGNQICLINPDGSGQQQLTTQGQNEDPAWAPNGRHIVFTSNRTGRKDIFVMHADGTEQRRLTNNGRDNYLPDWGS
jgi:TolB protein